MLLSLDSTEPESIKIKIALISQMKSILDWQEKTDINVQNVGKVRIKEYEKWFNNVNYNIDD